jgi:hypothetical protein
MRKWSTADAGALEHSYEAHRDAEIGAEWLRDALAEHASVGAFSAFNLSLLALGAPADLVRGGAAAALDEVFHAKACFALASRHDDRRLDAIKLGPSVRAMDSTPLGTQIPVDRQRRPLAIRAPLDKAGPVCRESPVVRGRAAQGAFDRRPETIAPTLARRCQAGTRTWHRPIRARLKPSTGAVLLGRLPRSRGKLGSKTPHGSPLSSIVRSRLFSSRGLRRL